MRRMLVGVAVATIALAAALWLSRPDTLPNIESPRILGTLVFGSPVGPPAIDTEISAMDCRIVAMERHVDDQFLLTEECTWKNGRVERRRFLALPRSDGPSRGWMYRLAESDA